MALFAMAYKLASSFLDVINRSTCSSITFLSGYYNNAYYAKVGGVSTKEMNRLEMQLLFSLDFRLHVTVETFEQYCFRLGKETVCGLDQIERPLQACRINVSW